VEIINRNGESLPGLFVISDRAEAHTTTNQSSHFLMEEHPANEVVRLYHGTRRIKHIDHLPADTCIA
jgi:hypothetical protein